MNVSRVLEMGENTDSASLCPYLCLLQGRSLV